MAKEKTAPPIAVNRQAHHNYFIHETYECGIALTGTEVKSIRSGKANLRDSFAKVQRGEVFLWNAHISPYEQGNRYNTDPVRDRRLLLHKKEIRQLAQAIQRDGYTVIPLSVNLRGRHIKVDIALAKGKKLYDKRESLREADDKRRIERTLKDWG